MVKDYFQDIVPPHESDDAEDDVGLLRAPPTPPSPPPQTSMPHNSPERSIRNININRRAGMGAPPPPRTRGGKRTWIWVLAGVSLAALGVLLLLFLFKKTTITVVPHSQSVLFDESSRFTAYPAGSSASGTIAYTVKTADFEDSEAVAASGTEHKEEAAKGTITVINDYSTDPVKLIKNTRFETSSGLIFRTPNEIVVPGRKGDIPGKVSAEVTADKAGDQYNTPAGQKLTLPGLKSTPAMYSGVYAMTESALAGGFSGDAPSVAAGVLSAAKATMQARLDSKVNDFVATLGSDSQFALSPVVTFADKPTGAVTNGSVNVGMTAHVSVAVVERSALAAAIAQLVTADGAGQRYTLQPGAGFAASVADTGSLGSDPITLVLSGTGVLIAEVDTEALAAALAGRDQSAFQTIVANFPGVDSAKARIEPLWTSTFPKNPSEIHIVLAETPNAQK